MVKYGLKKSQIDLIMKCISSCIKKKNATKVWIFGSRARGGHKKYSDIDLVLESGVPIEKRQKSEMISLLEESDLPFKVDLLLRNEIYEPYRAKIESEMKLLGEV